MEMSWNQVVYNENWAEAERIQRLADGIGQAVTESSAQIEQPTQATELE
jgi:hypothetical protein